MRPSNKRSRSNKNRPRSLGNVVNRVFDSSGPEGKVRGTPQQIIDKYTALARDAQLSGDRVAAENFQQHAEHYTRMLNEALAEQAKEAEARREQQLQQQQNQNQNRRHDPRDESGGDAEDGAEQRPDARGDRTDGKDRRGNRRNNRRDNDNRDVDQRDGRPQGDADAVAPSAPQTDASESMLVETPESRASETPAPQQTDAPVEDKPKRARKPRKPRVAAEPAAEPATAAQPATEQPAPNADTPNADTPATQD